MVGVEQQAPFQFARVFLIQLIRIYLFQVVFGCSRKAQLVTDKVFEYGAAVAADRAVRFVLNN